MPPVHVTSDGQVVPSVSGTRNYHVVLSTPAGGRATWLVPAAQGISSLEDWNSLPEELLANLGAGVAFLADVLTVSGGVFTYHSDGEVAAGLTFHGTTDPPTLAAAEGGYAASIMWYEFEGENYDGALLGGVGQFFLEEQGGGSPDAALTEMIDRAEHYLEDRSSEVRADGVLQPEALPTIAINVLPVLGNELTPRSAADVAFQFAFLLFEVVGAGDESLQARISAAQARSTRPKKLSDDVRQLLTDILVYVLTVLEGTIDVGDFQRRNNDLAAHRAGGVVAGANTMPGRPTDKNWLKLVIALMRDIATAANGGS